MAVFPSPARSHAMPQARLRLDALVVAEAFRVIRIAVGDHAVVAIAGSRNEAPDEHVRQRLIRDRIERDVRAVDDRRLIEPRRLGRIVAVGNENRRGLARIPRRVPQETHAVVERQTPGRLPRVLRVELVDVALADHFGERIDLGVVAERSEQRVRVAVVRVERVVGVGAEVELPGPRARADAALAFGVLRQLEVVAAP